MTGRGVVFSRTKYVRFCPVCGAERSVFTVGALLAMHRRRPFPGWDRFIADLGEFHPDRLVALCIGCPAQEGYPVFQIRLPSAR